MKQPPVNNFEVWNNVQSITSSSLHAACRTCNLVWCDAAEELLTRGRLWALAGCELRPCTKLNLTCEWWLTCEEQFWQQILAGGQQKGHSDAAMLLSSKVRWTLTVHRKQHILLGRLKQPASYPRYHLQQVLHKHLKQSSVIVLLKTEHSQCVWTSQTLSLQYWCHFITHPGAAVGKKRNVDLTRHSTVISQTAIGWEPRTSVKLSIAHFYHATSTGLLSHVLQLYPVGMKMWHF